MIKINYKEENYHIGGLLNKIKLNKKVDDEAIRSPKDYNVDLSELSYCIEKNKEKIESIEYIIDDELVLSENKQVKTLEEIMKDIKVRKINL